MRAGACARQRGAEDVRATRHHPTQMVTRVMRRKRGDCETYADNGVGNHVLRCVSSLKHDPKGLGLRRTW